MPENWVGFVQERKVLLSDALRRPANDIRDQLLEDYLDQLGRESMRKRVDILNERYQPAPPFAYEGRPYRFDRDRLEAIDRHLTGIIHRLELSGEATGLEEDDLFYLEASSFYFIHIVSPALAALGSTRCRDTIDVLLHR